MVAPNVRAGRVLAITVVLFVAVFGGAASQARTRASTPTCTRFGGLGVCTTLNTATFTFTTKTKSTASVSTSVDASLGLVVLDQRAKTVHKITIPVAPATKYNFKVTATPAKGKPATWKGSFSTAAIGSVPATVTSTNGRLLVNGVPWPIVATEFLSDGCYSPSAVAADLALRVNLFMGSVWGCPQQSDLLAGMSGKAWFTDSLASDAADGGNNAGIDQQTNFLGWNQPESPEYSFRPQDLPSPPADGKPSFMDFSTAFWNGETPDWYGDGQPPVWDNATVAAYFSKSDVLGLYKNPYGGTCWKTSPADIYNGISSLVADSHKPAIVWIQLTPVQPSCHAGNLTPLQVVNQMWTGIEAKAQGVGLLTLSQRTAFTPYDVSSNVAVAVSNAVAQWETYSPCLLSGANLPVKVSSSAITVRGCRYGGVSYVFATNSTVSPVNASLSSSARTGVLQVMGEGRSLKLGSGSFSDSFGPLATHIYRVMPALKK